MLSLFLVKFVSPNEALADKILDALEEYAMAHRDYDRNADKPTRAGRQAVITDVLDKEKS